MKALIPLWVATILLSGQAFAQEAPKPKPPATTNLQTSEQSDLEAQRRQQTEKQALRPPAPADTRVSKRPVTYGGFLVDVAKSERPAKMLSLRAPATGTNDAANVYTDPETERPRGFVLFSIKF